jgi:hypothetical protein
LYALINNAVQTLTDSVKKEERAIKRESTLRKQINGKKLLIEGAYKARVRRRALPLALENATNPSTTIIGPEEQPGATETGTGTVDITSGAGLDLEPYTKSS